MHSWSNEWFETNNKPCGCFLFDIQQLWDQSGYYQEYLPKAPSRKESVLVVGRENCYIAAKPNTVVLPPRAACMHYKVNSYYQVTKLVSWEQDRQRNIALYPSCAARLCCLPQTGRFAAVNSNSKQLLLHCTSTPAKSNSLPRLQFWFCQGRI